MTAGNKFKPGDKVIWNGYNGVFTPGKIYEIEKYTSDHNGNKRVIIKKDDKGNRYGAVFEYYFSKVDEKIEAKETSIWGDW